jgi:hypothetical protein
MEMKEQLLYLVSICICQMIIFLLCVVLLLYDTAEQVGATGNASDLYFKGAWFETWLGCWFS